MAKSNYYGGEDKNLSHLINRAFKVSDVVHRKYEVAKKETNPMKDESKNLPRNKKRSEENKKKFEEVAKRMKPFRHSEKLMMDTHLSEMARRRAEGYNVGWASGKDFISSKTSKGRLHTTHRRGSYNHEWEE